MLQSQVRYEPKHDPSHIEIGKQWLVQHKAEFRENTNYCIVSEQGEVEEHAGRVCHRNIGAPLLSGRRRSVVATEIAVNRREGGNNGGTTWSGGKNLTKERGGRFFDFFLNRSYVSPGIINRDDPEFCWDHGILISADQYAPLLQNTCIISRHFHEHTDQAFDSFNDMIKDGVDERIAYMFAFNSGWSKTGLGKAPKESVVTSRHGHCASPLPTLPMLRNFLRGDYSELGLEYFNDQTKHYRVNANYTGGFKFFFNRDDYNRTATPTGRRHIVYDLMQQEEFRHSLSEFRKKKTTGEMYHPPNPFTRPTGARQPAEGEVSYEEFFVFVAPYVQALMQKEGLVP